jgi:protein-L-isoaspartate O-methyltransferase
MYSPQHQEFEAYLRANFYAGRPLAPPDLNEHLFKREDRIRAQVVPWVANTIDLASAAVLEVGSGTGSSTAAFASHVRHIHAFEISTRATEASLARLKLFEHHNVSVVNAEFNAYSSLPPIDVVLLYAVLEHMTWPEMRATVGAAWDKLRPGGVMVVCETPNRLALYDYHTSWIPFFQQLPPELQREYAERSTREGYRESIRSSQHLGRDEFDLFMTRWGHGISYHEFELLFSEEFHKWIVADGYEEEILPIAPRYAEDDILEFAFSRRTGLEHISPAFRRWYLYFIARKPL